MHYALSALQLLVGTNTGRAACIAADGLPTLCGLMSGGERTTSSSLQLLYQVVYSLWSLSYFPEAALEMVTSKAHPPRSMPQPFSSLPLLPAGGVGGACCGAAVGWVSCLLHLRSHLLNPRARDFGGGL